jgi:hypothetical protein
MRDRSHHVTARVDSLFPVIGAIRETMKCLSDEIRRLRAELATKSEISVVERLRNDLALMRPNLTQQSSEHKMALTTLSANVSALKKWTGAMDSVIVFNFPAIFAPFGGRSWTLLWRGSRDEFAPKAFHDRSDKHRNTVTIVLDKKGNIFGGFTPLEWDYHPDDLATAENAWVKSDESLESFLFTLKNPHRSHRGCFGSFPTGGNWPLFAQHCLVLCLAVIPLTWLFATIARRKAVGLPLRDSDTHT